MIASVARLWPDFVEVDQPDRGRAEFAFGGICARLYIG
jgi:hypothetical protein